MTMTSSRSYIAKALYEWIIDNDCTPYILVDAHCHGVQVPMEYVDDGQVVLNISPVAIRALHIDTDALTFDGSFGGRELTITVPISALLVIYAQENGQGMVFEPELDQLELLDGGGASSTNGNDDKSTKQKKRPSLKVVK